MKNRRVILGVVALLTAIVVLVLWLRSGNDAAKRKGLASVKATQPAIAPSLPAPAPGTPTPPPNPMEAILQTPIQFFGIVLDQEGNPISGAQVKASVMNNLLKGTPLAATSDATGKFLIQSKGASLFVEVSKPGYYKVYHGEKLKTSAQDFDFAMIDGKGPYRPDPVSPVVFQLRKAGNPVELERLSAQPKVPRDGSGVSIRLSKTSNVMLRIRCRTVEDNEVPNAPYDWRCEVDVEGGGIQEAVDEHEFTAPVGGYAASAVIDMPKKLDTKKWNSRASKIYWLRFSDSTFAKIQFQMIARGDHFAVIEGFRNPTPNNRDLEPKLSVK